MAAANKIMLAVAGAGAFGAAFYAASSTTRLALEPSSNVPGISARDKKEMRHSAVGIGNTGMADSSQDRRAETAAPGHELRTGGVGGGSSAGSVESPLPSSTSSVGGQASSKPKSSSDLPAHNGNPYLREAEEGGRQQIFTKFKRNH